jgi:hypothetical protein
MHDEKINILHTIFKEFKFYSEKAQKNNYTMPFSLSKPPIKPGPSGGEESWGLNNLLGI